MDETSHVTTLTLDLKRVESNLKAIKKHIGSPEQGIIAVIKGYGYGTEATALAELLCEKNVAFLAVAYVEEGIRLREAGIEGRIIVLNPDTATFNALGDHKLEPCIVSILQLENYLVWCKNTSVKAMPVHLNFDTGMHRLGLNPHNIGEIARKLIQSDVLEIASVFTHLAGADSAEFDKQTKQQITIYKDLCDRLRGEFRQIKRLNGFLTHALNTAGVVRFPNEKFDLIRVGIGLFGSEPSGIEIGLLPAVKFQTLISLVREIPAGEGVGYNFSEPSNTNRTIAWLPVGYVDGYPLSLSYGKGVVAVGLRGRAKVVGRVCMDLTAIDVTGLDVKAGDSVELFGENIRIEDVAKAANTITYEILARVHERVVRVIIR